MKFYLRNFFIFLIFFIVNQDVLPLSLRFDQSTRKNKKNELLLDALSPKILYEGWFRMSSAGFYSKIIDKILFIFQ